MRAAWSVGCWLAVVVILGAAGGAEAQKPLAIGGALSLSGKYAKNGEYQQQAYQLLVEQINARGGLLGRPVELKLYDDRSDPATGVRLYERLISEDRVELLVGPYSSPLTAAVSTVTEKYKMVLVAPGAAANDIWKRGYRYVFQVISPAELEWEGAVALATQYGMKTLGLTGEDSDFPRAANPAGAELGEKRGLKVVNLGYYPKGTKDYSSIIVRAKAQGVEVFVCGCYEPDAIQLVRQSKELNYSAKMFVLSVGPTLPEYVTALGKDAEQVMSPDHWDPRVNTPGNREFVAAFVKKFGREPNYNAAAAYGSLQLLEAAVKKAGSLDKDRLRDALAQLDTVTVFGRYKVSDTGAQIGKLLFMIQWQSGKKEVIWPADVATAKPLLPVTPWSERK